MRTDQKKSPAYTDTDAMPFGKHKGKLMQDVPPHYLRWLYYEIKTNGYSSGSDAEKVHNYIFNQKEALEMELGEEI